MGKRSIYERPSKCDKRKKRNVYRQSNRRRYKINNAKKKTNKS